MKPYVIVTCLNGWTDALTKHPDPKEHPDCFEEKAEKI
jgi:hypothetical protein